MCLVQSYVRMLGDFTVLVWQVPFQTLSTQHTHLPEDKRAIPVRHPNISTTSYNYDVLLVVVARCIVHGDCPKARHSCPTRLHSSP